VHSSKTKVTHIVEKKKKEREQKRTKCALIL